MKRQITTATPTPIKAPKSPRSIENEFADMLEFMVAQMAQRFQNQVLGQLHVSTVEKFADISVTVSREFKVVDHYYDSTEWVTNDLSFTDAAGHTWEREERVQVPCKVPVFRYERRDVSVASRSMVDRDRILSFEDAQTGNFSSVLLRLSKAAAKKLLKQFSDDRIDTVTQKILGKLDKKSKEEFYKKVAGKTGINVADLIAKEGMKPTTNALMTETAQWVKTLRDDTFQKFTNNTLFGMSQGESLDTIVSQFDDVVTERKNHAKFLARNQVQNYNSVTTKIRAQNLGITKAIWETAGDERVRPSHEDREGKEFDLAEGLYSSVDGKYLLPGIDWNCRCNYTLIIPETEEPEEE